jgi:hypothetical protein
MTRWPSNTRVSKVKAVHGRVRLARVWPTPPSVPHLKLSTASTNPRLHERRPLICPCTAPLISCSHAPVCPSSSSTSQAGGHGRPCPLLASNFPPCLSRLTPALPLSWLSRQAKSVKSPPPAAGPLAQPCKVPLFVSDACSCDVVLRYTLGRLYELQFERVTPTLDNRHASTAPGSTSRRPAASTSMFLRGIASFQKFGFLNACMQCSLQLTLVGSRFSRPRMGCPCLFRACIRPALQSTTLSGPVLQNPLLNSLFGGLSSGNPQAL